MTPVLERRSAAKVFRLWAEDFHIPITERDYTFDYLGCGREYIYFAEAPGVIKIGWSKNPSERVAGMRMEPIVFISGQSRFEEQWLHRRLKEFAVRVSLKRGARASEWFDRNSPVASLAFRLANAARWEPAA